MCDRERGPHVELVIERVLFFEHRNDFCYVILWTSLWETGVISEAFASFSYVVSGRLVDDFCTLERFSRYVVQRTSFMERRSCYISSHKVYLRCDRSDSGRKLRKNYAQF